MSLSKKVLFFLATLVFIAVFMLVIIRKSESRPTLYIGNAKIFVNFANTDEERQKGLSGRDNLAEKEGLLFVFDKDSNPGFWMKDMLIPIDIIWINDGKIIQIDKNVPPPPLGTSLTDLAIYRASIGIDYVLEVNSGFSEKNGLKVGDNISLEE